VRGAEARRTAGVARASGVRARWNAARARGAVRGGAGREAARAREGFFLPPVTPAPLHEGRRGKGVAAAVGPVCCRPATCNFPVGVAARCVGPARGTTRAGSATRLDLFRGRGARGQAGLLQLRERHRDVRAGAQRPRVRWQHAPHAAAQSGGARSCSTASQVRTIDRGGLHKCRARVRAWQPGTAADVMHAVRRCLAHWAPHTVSRQPSGGGASVPGRPRGLGKAHCQGGLRVRTAVVQAPPP
jgi:hypothetical protein